MTHTGVPKRRSLARTGRILMTGCALFAILGLVALALVEHWRGNEQLEQWRKNLAASGEPLTTGQFAPAPITTNQNAAPALLAAADILDKEAQAAEKLPHRMHFHDDESVVVVSKLKRWRVTRSEDEDAEPELADWSAARERVELLEGILKPLVAELLTKEHIDFGLDYPNATPDMEIKGAVEMIRVVRKLSALAIYQMALGKSEDALNTTLALTRLSSGNSRNLLLIFQLTFGSAAMTAQQVTWQLLHSTEPQPEQLARLQSAWEKQDFLTPMVHALKLERTASLRMYDQLMASDDRLIRALQGQADLGEVTGDEQATPPEGWVYTRLYLPFWKFAWSKQDLARGQRGWDLVIAVADKVQAEGFAASASPAFRTANFFSVFATERPDYNWYERKKYLLFSSHTPAHLVAGVKVAAQRQTLAEMVTAALALERHKKTTGQYPATLEALRPTLERAPRDHMDGEPLRYKATADGAYLLYSVGDDMIDDGGDPTRTGKDKRQLWQAKDAVWPQPVIVESIES